MATQKYLSIIVILGLHLTFAFIFPGRLERSYIIFFSFSPSPYVSLTHTETFKYFSWKYWLFSIKEMSPKDNFVKFSSLLQTYLILKMLALKSLWFKFNLSHLMYNFIHYDLLTSDIRLRGGASVLLFSHCTNLHDLAV